MKTLDEVIYHLENCAYAPLTEDALHYLREYRTCHENLIRNCDRHEELYNQYRDMIDELEKNDPLTWDELKQMEGKPVWIKYDGYKPMWDIVDKIIDRRTIETYKCMLHDEGIGIYWQAYRKER